MHRLILDVLSGHVLDASTDDFLVVEIPDDQVDLDLIEAMVNNWSIPAVCSFAESADWVVKPLFEAVYIPEYPVVPLEWNPIIVFRS